MQGSGGSRGFYGWRVVAGAFVLAVFGWGTGFYGPPVFLSVLHAERGWPVGLISAAVTLHFLVGAAAGANLPALHQRFGVPRTTRLCAVAMAIGLAGWSLASEPWHLFAASLLTGSGWCGMSAAALNAIVSPWFDRRRPAALGMAYNGGSVGGVIFSPLWVAAIAAAGFVNAALGVAAVMVVVLWLLAGTVFAIRPEQMGLEPDGEPAPPSSKPSPPTAAPVLQAGAAGILRDRRYLTLTAAMSLGLFAQIGLVAHLHSLLTPALGGQVAGFAMGLVTAMAIAGRTVLGWAMPPGADRRLVACLGYAAQLAGSLAFLGAAGSSVPLLLLGVVLFGAGFGNATSLPPLVAQVELDRAVVQRAVALMVGTAQGVYAFAPAAFGLLRDLLAPVAGAASGHAPAVFAAAAILQGLAIAAFLAGRRLP